MKKANQILYIFDLKNTQEQYACCTEIIKILETEHPHDRENIFERLKSLLDRVQVSGCPLNYHGSKAYFEQPLNLGELSFVSRAKSVRSERVQKNILNRNNNVFHIRIHLDRDENHCIKNLSNLQFLVLMIKGVQQLLEKKSETQEKTEMQDKFSVFAVPYTGKYYPFRDENESIDEETYEEISQYLRLFAHANNGLIYGAMRDSDRVVVRAINFRKSAKLRESFPLIPMTRTGYDALFKNNVNDEVVNTLFELRKNWRYGKANDENPEKAIGDFAIESAYHRMRDVVLETYCEEALAYLKQALIDYCAAERISVMAFVLLGFTFSLLRCESSYQTEITSRVKQLHTYVVDLCAGLSQLAQNSLQYSESQEAELALHLQNEQEDPSHCYVEFSLADYNSQRGLIETFLANLNVEIQNTDNESIKKAYRDLVDQEQGITLSDFFGEYNRQSPELGQAWRNFRRADTAAHIGLAVFSLSTQKYNGSILVVNSITGSVDEKSRYYREGKFADGTRIAELSAPAMIFPGTQIMVRLPLTRSDESYTGIGQLRSASLEENYEVFAKYLDWGVEKIPLALTDELSGKQGQSIMDAAVKRQNVSRWEKAWRYTLRTIYVKGETPQSVYHYNLGWMSDSEEYMEDYYEIFLKGFINALNEITGKGPYCIALCDAPRPFMQVFRRLCVSLAAKSFPKGLQLYVYCKDDVNENILLCGDTFYSAVNTAYQLSLEHGTSAFEEKERELCRQLYETLHEKMDANGVEQEKTKIFPFDAMLIVPGTNSQSVFARRIEELAERSLDEHPYGYKLVNTHMRLGNKVHIQSFYEMSFLFYRTAVSNRLAFEILNDLLKSDDIDLLNDSLLFYGYASYSKALLTALLEIVTAYRQKENGEKECQMPIAIASYQYNLQSELRTKGTQVYFDFSNSSLGKNTSQTHIELKQPSIKVVQIVPISSTLTTFGKMKNELVSSLGGQAEKIKAWINYTMFWVVDEQAGTDSQQTKLSNKIKQIRDYYTIISPKDRLVASMGEREEQPLRIKYFMKATTHWHNPLACELCFPSNPICEVPLVETDQTSTVPTQQIRAKRENHGYVNHSNNDDRITALKDCVLYGHIKRDNNHFTYYIDTQKYFNVVGGKLKRWLEEARAKATDKNPSTAMLNIIFSPEHSTNVGFAQYVNNYYFGGSAEVVCINKNKQYRSNFECEHKALIRTIQELLKEAELSGSKDVPVQFFFADDTIVSGDSFYKANSFLRSLIPQKYQNKYPSNLFSKCFLLVDRLSKESKTAYVRDPETNFISYVHLDVSSIRVQGDSCVGCKAHQNAARLLRRSATQKGEKHWKSQLKDLTVLNFDQEGEIQKIENIENAFRRLVLSHVAQNSIFGENDSFSVGRVYDTLLILLTKILNCQLSDSVSTPANCSYGELLEKTRVSDPIQDVKLFIDTVSRPFFSFDFKVRVPVQTLLLLWAENLFGVPVTDEQLKKDEEFHKYLAHKGFLLENGRLEATNQLIDEIKKYLGDNLADFMQECILKALVEMRSTYLIRKSTFQKVYKLLDKCDEEKIKKYLDQYAVQIQQLLDGTTDEIKSLWLEYILISGEEYDPNRPAEFSKIKRELADPLIWYDNSYGVDTAANNKDPYEEENSKKKLFCQFGREVFLQNSRILFDGMEELYHNKEIGDYHFMDCWRKFRQLDCSALRSEYMDLEGALQREIDLFGTIKSVLGEYDENLIYDRLIDAIYDIADKKYGLQNPDVACLTSDSADLSDGVQQIDIVFKRFSVESRLKPYRLKKCFLKAQKDSLKEVGYYQGEDEADVSTKYVFIRFGHQEDKKPSEGISPQPVYLYVGFDKTGTDNPTLHLLLLLRDILSYRNRLQRIFDKHFSGRAISKYAHTAAQREIVANEKAVSHNTTSGDRAALEVLQNQNKVGNYKLLDSSQVSKWLLLRSYTNSQIAKLFNRTCIRDDDWPGPAIDKNSVPPLYLEKEPDPQPWKERPLCGFHDLCLAQDNRFGLLSTAVYFDYSSDLRKAEFIQNSRGEYYNAEYFRCLLIDIFFTAMKYKSNGEEFLQYIDKYLAIEQDIKNQAILPEYTSADRKDQRCIIELRRQEANDSNATFDYLVIRNRVSCEAHSLFDLKWSNKSIKARLRDPLDYPDGHLSLLTISRYIENLREDLKEACEFKYTSSGETGSDAVTEDVYFESWLPVLEKEN